MFIEIAEVRINTDHIITYVLKETLILMQTSLDEYPIKLNHNSLEEARQTIIALDRAVGIKPLMIRK